MFRFIVSVSLLASTAFSFEAKELKKETVDAGIHILTFDVKAMQIYQKMDKATGGKFPKKRPLPYSKEYGVSKEDFDYFIDKSRSDFMLTKVDDIKMTFTPKDGDRTDVSFSFQPLDSLKLSFLYDGRLKTAMGISESSFVSKPSYGQPWGGTCWKFKGQKNVKICAGKAVKERVEGSEKDNLIYVKSGKAEIYAIW